MAEVLYLGQSILRKFEVDTFGDKKEIKEVPAIYLGKNSEEKPVILINMQDLDPSFEKPTLQRFHLNNGYKDCDFVREKYDLSPSGKRIYFGGLTRKFMGSALLKAPETELVLKELETIKKVKV